MEKSSWGGAGGQADTSLLGGIRRREITSSSISVPLSPTNDNTTRLAETVRAVDSTTGVAHFRHINAPNLMTFVFSNGRHESSGINSYATVDFNYMDPFGEGIQEEALMDESEVGGGAYTWVSTSTFTQRHEGGVIRHYVLFSGGNDRHRTIFPSVLYSFEEKDDGSLAKPVKEWEASPRLPARFGILKDLGNIPMMNNAANGSTSVVRTATSKAGYFDIIIAGYNGLDIYSLQEDGSYQKTRHLPVIGETAISYLGVDLYNPTASEENLDQALLIVTSRSRWKQPGVEFDAPCFFYDYRLNTHYHHFAQEGQTLSVAVIDDNNQMLIAAGGNDKMEGQPNLMHKFITDSQTRLPSSVLMDAEYQLVPGIATTYNRMRIDSERRTPEDKFEEVAFEGLTKTRQVFPFRLPGSSTRDYIVEVNEGQPAYIYCRNHKGQTFRIIPLQDNERDLARAADAVVTDHAVHILVARFFAENIVYTVDMDLLRETKEQSPAAPQMAAASQQQLQQQHQKVAPLEEKCGSMVSSSGYGGAGAGGDAVEDCTRTNHYQHESSTTKRLRGDATGFWAR